MGLNVCVGGLPPAELEELNRYLTGQKMPAHEEPPGERRQWRVEDLEGLRRVAAFLQYERKVPREDDDAYARLDRYYGDKSRDEPAVGFRKKASHGRRFDHLIFHSEVEGYYLPRDFETVLSSEDVQGLELGSLPRLVQELTTLEAELASASWMKRERDDCRALLEAARAASEVGAVLAFT